MGNDIKEKSAEEYREAAHYWQEKWNVSQKKLAEAGSTLQTLRHYFERPTLQKAVEHSRVICDGKELTVWGCIDWTIEKIK